MKKTELIPSYIDNIPLPLTENGKISFSVFPQSVITYALRNLKNCQKSDPESRARYLYGICKKYSQQQNLAIRYDWAFKLKEQYDIPKNAQFAYEPTPEYYKQQAEALSSSCTHRDATHYDATATRPGSPTHQDNTLKGESDHYQQSNPNYKSLNGQDEETNRRMFAFMREKDREMIRKLGLDMDLCDELEERYKEKRQAYRNKRRRTY